MVSRVAPWRSHPAHLDRSHQSGISSLVCPYPLDLEQLRIGSLGLNNLLQCIEAHSISHKLGRQLRPKLPFLTTPELRICGQQANFDCTDPEYVQTPHP